MDSSWQNTSGSGGNYEVTYSPGLDLTAPYYEQSHEQPPPHTQDMPSPPTFRNAPPYPYAQAHDMPHLHPYHQPPARPYPQPPARPYPQPVHQYPQPPAHPYPRPQREGSNDQVVVIQDDNDKRKKREKNYLIQEDETLCSAWLNVSKDPIVGTSQGAKTFWGRISNYFNEHRKTPINRSISSLQHRWSDIKKEVAFFTGFYSKAVRRNQSGYNEDDKIKEALQLYEGKYEGKQFKLMHCWLILRHEHKWNELVDELLTGNTPESGRQPSAQQTATEEQPSVPESAPGRMERPMGRDRAKKQRSSSGGSNSAACYEMIQKMQLDRGKFEEYMKAINKDECEAMSSCRDKKLELQTRATIVQEKMFELQARATMVQEKMFELQEKEREDRIMSMPLDEKDPWAREYYLNQKKAIAAKSSARSSEERSDRTQNP